MKDNLLEILMNLFENSFSQLQENQKALDKQVEQLANSPTKVKMGENQEVEANYFKSPKPTATRIFTYAEQMKLTKASYQFLKRMELLCVMEPDIMELIMNQLFFSDSHIVTLQETKWTIRKVMSNFLTKEEMTFLDLILYHKEDELIAH